MSRELFGNSELAQAAYSALVQGQTASQLDALEDEGLTDAQLDSFKERYTEVVTQVTDSTTGFSATVFKDTSSATGNLAIAFRGTEPGRLGLPHIEDANSDLILATSGAAFNQIISMYNWWQLISGTPGQYVDNVKKYILGMDVIPTNAVHLYGELVQFEVAENRFSIST